MNRFLGLRLWLICACIFAHAQIKLNDVFSLSSYGRLGISTEAHYQIRDYYTNIEASGDYQYLGQASMTKFSIIPTLVPTG